MLEWILKERFKDRMEREADITGEVLDQKVREDQGRLHQREELGLALEERIGVHQEENWNE